MEAFADPSIKAVISNIGGDDSIRMLKYIDLDVIRNNPKIFLGFSDSTVTHFICLKAGLSSFYGTSLLVGFAEKWCMIIRSMTSTKSYSPQPLSGRFIRIRKAGPQNF
jgi:muramoyltetrapeptide carboxypeptidase LdcA involved in peptidoglycan recycling